MRNGNEGLPSAFKANDVKPSPLEHGPPDVLIGKQQANSVLKEHQTTNKTVSDQLCQLSDRVYTVRMLPNQKLF